MEIDGPAHFVTVPGRPAADLWPTGATRLRDARLRRWGFEVLSIPVKDGRHVHSRSRLRSGAFQAELARLLRGRGVPLPLG